MTFVIVRTAHFIKPTHCSSAKVSRLATRIPRSEARSIRQPGYSGERTPDNRIRQSRRRFDRTAIDVPFRGTPAGSGAIPARPHPKEFSPRLVAAAIIS